MNTFIQNIHPEEFEPEPEIEFDDDYCDKDIFLEDFVSLLVIAVD